MGPSGLVLYTSEQCGLCDRAKEALARLGAAYEELPVGDDHPYRLRTPVLEARGRIVAEGDLSWDVLRRALAG
jgi:glutaredoxin